MHVFEIPTYNPAHISQSNRQPFNIYMSVSSGAMLSNPHGLGI